MLVGLKGIMIPFRTWIPNILMLPQYIVPQFNNHTGSLNLYGGISVRCLENTHFFSDGHEGLVDDL